jgi:hypothetical protein
MSKLRDTLSQQWLTIQDSLLSLDNRGARSVNEETTRIGNDARNAAH